ncbi:MAG: phenylalanine--tRNA ligase subunit beta [Thermodesulfobacteriota bacterium]
MKVSLSWLSRYLPVEMPAADIAEALTMAGLEVDSVFDRYAYLNTVRVGRVAAVHPHPNADKLKLCEVTIGDRTHRVVCGAPNVRPDMLAPLALPGTLFPNGLLLEQSVIRGQASEGMLCSEGELELGPDRSGIMDLDPDSTVGAPLTEALNLHDPVIEIDLTPNRPDCLSLLGIAREVAAIQGNRVTYPEARLSENAGEITGKTSVTIEDPDHCPRYAARMVEGITIGPSPFWLQDRLLSVGLRPINNIVDITNFVMMETGQPLHAFDFDHLEEHRIVVRTANEGEKFTTLDGKERTLASDMLMICDGKKPVAVGGVMGGLNSEIENTTTRVLIESAYFDPVSIRRTAKRLGLGTDASHRFERGVDPDGILAALDRAAHLMVEIGGGALVDGLIDERPKIVENRPVTLNVSRTNRVLGIDLDADRIADLLRSIEFGVEKEGPNGLTVTVPSFRVDVTRPEDLMEEVARLWGYNRIPVTSPAMPAEAVRPTPRMTARNRIKDLMSGYGFAEAVNYSFIDRGACDKLRLKEDDPRRRLLEILNPLTEEQTVMRTSLIPGLLETMGRNLAWQMRNLRLFEIGKTFVSNGQEALPDETEMLAGLLTGAIHEGTWHTEERPTDFFDLKGTAEALLNALSLPDLRFTAMDDTDCTYTRPGYTARILAGDQDLGLLGEVHPTTLKAYDLKQTAFIVELNLDRLIPLISDEKQARPIPRFPSVARDITIIVDRSVEADDLLRSVLEMDEELVEDLFLFDLYEGENIPQGRKSVSFRIIYRSALETLEDEAVTGIHQRISDMLLKKYNAAFPT